MSEQRASSPPTAGELAALRKVVAVTETQISTIRGLIAAFSEDLEKTSVEQRQIEAELATRRQTLLEWTRSRDLLAKAHLSLISGAQSHLHVAHIREKSANPTATPSDDELARQLVEQESNVINAIRSSMDMRESTISVLHSRIAVLEEDIAGCKAAYSHTSSMIASEASHMDQLQVLLGRYKSRLHPLIQLPDTCLQDVFLHVVQLAWEGCEGLQRMRKIVSEPVERRMYLTNPMLALTAVCHRWRTVATHTPELWSKYIKVSQLNHARLAHHVRLVKNRELSILMFLEEGDIQSLEVIKSSNVRLDTLTLVFGIARDRTERAMKILPSPRTLMLLDLGGDFLPISLPKEFLSRTEVMYTRDCHVTIEFTAPTLQKLDLFLAHVITTPRQYIPSLLRNTPQLHCLSIKCQTTRGLPIDPHPLSLLVSPGVCESVKYLQIHLKALCGPLKALQTSFTLPNLVQLSLLKFLQEGSDHQSWGNFCRLNGGKIKRLDLDLHYSRHPFAPGTQPPLLPGIPGLEFAQHLNLLPGIKYLSLHAFFVHPMLALLTDDGEKKGEGRESLLLPNMEICEIRGVVSSAVKARFEEAFSSWSKARNSKEGNEATGQHVATTVLWT